MSTTFKLNQEVRLVEDLKATTQTITASERQEIEGRLVPELVVRVKDHWYLADGPRAGCAANGSVFRYITESK